GREAWTEVVGEGLGIVGHHRPQLAGECRDADRAHARSPLGSLRPKKKPPDLSGPVAFPSVGGVYGLRWEFASSRRKATGPNRGALRSPRAPAGTAHGVVRHLAVAHQEQMTRRRAQHLSLPSAALYLHGRRSPLQGIRFHARPRSPVTQGDHGGRNGLPSAPCRPRSRARQPLKKTRAMATAGG